MAVETVKLAISLGLISRSDLLGVISNIEARSEFRDLRSELLLERCFSVLNEIIESTIKRTAPGLLELLNIYYTHREKKLLVTRILPYNI